MAQSLDLGNLLVHLRANTMQYTSAMKRAQALMKSFAATVKRYAKVAAVAIGTISIASLKAFASFDSAMTKSLAIMSDVTPRMRKKMERLALELSSKGVTSAKDLAKSYFYLASAGFTAEQSLAALGTVEKFAVAGAFDMALATDLLTDAQSALGLTVKDAQQNMINMARVSDVLTGANTLANATTQQFSEALTSQAGPAMKAYKIGLEEGVAVLAAYADQGIKAQRAGNMLSRMLRLMVKGALDNREAWEKFNLNIFDATGELKPLYTIIGDLSDVLETMSTKQKSAVLQMLGFQARSQQAILPLLGLQDRIKEYNDELLKMSGITKEVTEKQLKSFSSQMRILWNNIKNVGIAIGSRLAPSIERLGLWIRTNRRVIEDWAIAFADRMVFVGEAFTNLLVVMKSDLERGKGLSVVGDIALEFFVGFGKSLVVIMKDAGIKAANAFIQNFGESLGAWLVEVGKPEGALGELSMLSPAIAAGRIAIMKAGIGMVKAARKPEIPTDLKGQLLTIKNETLKNIKEIEKASGIDLISGPLANLHNKDTLRKIKFWWNGVKDAMQPVMERLKIIKDMHLAILGLLPPQRELVKIPGEIGQPEQLGGPRGTTREITPLISPAGLALGGGGLSSLEGLIRRHLGEQEEQTGILKRIEQKEVLR